MVRSNQRIPHQGDLLAVRNHLGGQERLVVGQARKRMIRAVDFWVDSDLGCPLAVDRIRKSQVERKPRSRLLAGQHLVEVECLARNLAALGVSPRLDKRVVAF